MNAAVMSSPVDDEHEGDAYERSALHDTERDLMRRVAAADPAAQRALAERLTARVRRLCRRLLSEHSEWEDAAQLAVLEVFAAAGSYRGASSVERWADRITVRTALRVAKERMRRWERTDGGDPDRLPTEGALRVAREELSRDPFQYLEALPPVLRTVIVLRHVLDYSIGEIAEMTQVSPNTVKDRLLRGRKELRRSIRRDRTLGVKTGGTP